MKDGSVLIGEITSETLTFKGTYAVATLKAPDIQSYADGMLHLNDQTVLKGSFGDNTISVKTSTATLSLPGNDIIGIHPPGASAESAPPGATTSTPSQGESFPQVYGCYALTGKQMVGLFTSQISTCLGLTMRGNPGRGVAVDGYAGTPQKLAGPVRTILVYQHDINPNQLVLATLGFVKTMAAGEFNISGTNPSFFESIYGVPQNAPVNVNLWRLQDNIPFDISPIEAHKDMYKLSFRKDLPAGTYTLSYNGVLHPITNIFTASAGQTATGYFFQIQSLKPDRADPDKTLANSGKNSGNWPQGIPIPFMPGYVESPFINAAPIDVRAYPPGTPVSCPYTHKIFIVPKMPGN